MGPLTLIAYYVLFWWMTLFAVLSIGLRTQDEEGEIVAGTEPSAPAKLRLWRNLGLNTVLSGVLFAIWYYVTQILGFGVDDVLKFLPGPPR